MTARQALGEALCELSPTELASIPIADAQLLEAIEQARDIRAHGALRRHRQYIGKLMRRVDPQPIRDALAALHQVRAEETAAFRDIERLRDALLARGDAALPAVIERFPAVNRQELRQLVRRAREEAASGGNGGGARRLFRYLRSLQTD